jgi:hypothetical protein
MRKKRRTIMAYTPEAFGFENVIFFTPEGVDVSAARRALPALALARRADVSLSFTASRRFALKDPSELEGCHATVTTGHENMVAHSRPTRVSALPRRIMVRTTRALIPCPLYTIQ